LSQQFEKLLPLAVCAEVHPETHVLVAHAATDTELAEEL
jgi:hypothetical protein